jgi:hypothetical protein
VLNAMVALNPLSKPFFSFTYTGLYVKKTNFIKEKSP